MFLTKSKQFIKRRAVSIAGTKSVARHSPADTCFRLLAKQPQGRLVPCRLRNISSSWARFPTGRDCLKDSPVQQILRYEAWLCIIVSHQTRRRCLFCMCHTLSLSRMRIQTANSVRRHLVSSNYCPLAQYSDGLFCV